VALNAGSYSVSETGPSGYTQTSSTDCTGSIAVGETKTCTITNNDIQPKLIVIKHVVNDNGGTAVAGNFTLSVTGNSPSPASFAGAESPGATVALNAGSYSVSETGPSGYSGSSSADCSGSIAVGETKTCTVTNDDIQPKLTVIKHVINNNGGTATAANFTMTVTGSSPSPASFPGAESPGTTVALNAGSYNVTETGPAGYAASLSADCTGSIAVGQTKTCTITNDDKYNFFGFFSPVDNWPIVNVANSGQAIPVKYRLTDANGIPVSNPANFVSLTSYAVSCGDFSSSPSSEVTEYTAGSSGLQYLGDGNWIYVWKTPKSYANSCRTMVLNLNDGSRYLANFRFPK
jgi:hypothetical protein